MRSAVIRYCTVGFQWPRTVGKARQGKGKVLYRLAAARLRGLAQSRRGSAVSSHDQPCKGTVCPKV